jgi:hypothetical protein
MNDVKGYQISVSESFFMFVRTDYMNHKKICDVFVLSHWDVRCYDFVFPRIGASYDVRCGHVFMFRWALADGHIFVTSTNIGFAGGTGAGGSALDFDDFCGNYRNSSLRV